MVTTRRVLLIALLACASAALPVTARQTAPAVPSLTPEQMEAFLLNGQLVSSRRTGEGVTNSLRGTFTDGQITHDVHIQSIDESRAVFEAKGVVELNFRDSYKYNVAAYRLAVALDLDNVPMSVLRRIQGRDSAVTWWIDDVMMDEGDRMRKRTTGPDPSRYASQVHIGRVFDELIANTDRNAGNTQWTKDWKMWLIDHTRAFRTNKELRNTKLLERVDRTMMARMRDLTEARVREIVGDTLNEPEVEAVAARAEALVKFFDDRIAKTSEGQVLYTKR